MNIVTQSVVKTSLTHKGYIAGAGDGIVTVQGKPASRKIWLLNSKTMLVERTHVSLKNGHYVFFGLNPSDKYMVIVRDLEPDGIRWTGEAVAWDYVEPATDIDFDEQMALWLSWQSV